MMEQSNLEQIEDEAASWIVMLLDEPDDIEQLTQFSIWLNTSPLHAEMWERTCRAYTELGGLLPSTQGQWPARTSDESKKNHIEKRTGGFFECLLKHAINWRYSLSGLAVTACLMLVFSSHITLWMSADYVSAIGERQTYLLEDGSTLILAPDSAVDIRYTEGERNVRMLKGSAFFAVQRNSEKPFVVEAGHTRTTVLGTAFGVEMSKLATIVSVEHGLVRVDDSSVFPEVSAQLAAGEKIAIGDKTLVSDIDPDDVARWRMGELIARDLSVGEVIDSFRRYYDGMIIVTEPFASQRITGLYRLDDPVATLSQIARAHGATAKQISPWLLVLSE